MYMPMILQLSVQFGYIENELVEEVFNNDLTELDEYTSNRGRLHVNHSHRRNIQIKF